jgi:hypothetical protein
MVADPGSSAIATSIVGFWVLLVATVRMFSIYGRVVAGDNRNRRHIAQIAIGFSAAVSICTGVASVLNTLGRADVLGAISIAWVISIPVALGLAAFFAQVDRSTSLTDFQATTAQQIIALSSIAAFTCLLVAPAVQFALHYESPPGDQVYNQTLGASGEATGPISITTPAKIVFDIKASGVLNIKAGLSFNCAAQLFGPSHNLMGNDWGYSNIKTLVSPGEYTLRVESRYRRDEACYPEFTADMVLKSLGELLLGTVPSNSRPGRFSVDIDLRTKPG